MSKPKKNRARKCWTTAVTGVASVAVASAYGASLLPQDEPKKMSYDVMETAAIVEAPSTIGVAEGADLYWLAAADPLSVELNKTLSQMQSLGVETVRVGIPWGLVEAGAQGSYDWTVVKRIIDAADGRGMGVLGVIYGSPARYGVLPPGAPHPPVGSQAFTDYLAAFSAFTKAAAVEFKGKVGAYEIWNEPNYIGFWNPVDAAAYTELLKTGYMAIKGDPDNPNDGLDESALVIGGVVGATQSSFFTLDPVTFVEQMYAAGADDFFDALSFHPYAPNAQDPTEFTDRGDDGPWLSPIEQLEAIRAVMDAKADEEGDPYLKIWISEYGVSTEGWVTPEERQAEWDDQVRLLENMLRTWQTVNGAGPIFLYTTRDQATGAPGDQANYGIFQTDWTPKDAAALIKQLIAEFNAPTNPGNPPMDPISAFFAQLAQGFSQFFGSIFAPNLFSQMFSAIGNFFGSIFGAPAATVAAAAPPNENLALMADESDTGDASRSVDPDAVGAASDGEEVADGLGEGNNLVEGDAPPAGEELNPTVENVEPLVVEKTVESDVDPDLELSKLEAADDGKTADELKDEELKDDEVKDDELKKDELKDDDDVKTVDGKPADGTVTNGSVTTPKANDGATPDKPDADSGGDAGAEGGGDEGSEGGDEN
jgi:polysaccharide biosynthesis protein PslG